jgi:hypothetical protein
MILGLIILILIMQVVLTLVLILTHESPGSGEFTTADRVDLQYVLRKVRYMSRQLEHLRSAVTAQTTIIGSVQTLLTNLAARIRTASSNDDSEALESIASDIDQNSTLLASAVAANTVADDGTDPTVPVGNTSGPADNGGDPSTQPAADVTSGDTSDIPPSE